MLPLLKILTVLFKVFSKPLINYAKKSHINRKNFQKSKSFSSRLYISFGNRINIFESKINRKFLNISNEIPLKIKPLKDEDALEKGLEYFYEIVFYLILLMLPAYEMHKSLQNSKIKSTELKNRLEKIEINIKDTKDNLIVESQKVNGKMKDLQAKINQTDTTLLDILNFQIQKRNENSDELSKAFSQSKILVDEIMKGGKQVDNMLKKIQKQEEKIASLIISNNIIKDETQTSK